MSTQAKQRVKEIYEGTDIDPPRDTDTDEILLHTEWNGWLYCEVEMEPFDWQTGDIECPHCGEEFHVPEPIYQD